MINNKMKRNRMMKKVVLRLIQAPWMSRILGCMKVDTQKRKKWIRGSKENIFKFLLLQVYDIFKWAIGYINVSLYGVAEIWGDPLILDFPFPLCWVLEAPPESARAAGWCRATHQPVLIGERTPTESNALDDLGYMVTNDDDSQGGKIAGNLGTRFPRNLKVSHEIFSCGATL